MLILQVQFIEAHRLQVHDIADVEAEDPIVLAVGFDAKSGASSNFIPFLALQVVDLLKGLE
jgi:hypothetical protein